MFESPPKMPTYENPHATASDPSITGASLNNAALVVLCSETSFPSVRS